MTKETKYGLISDIHEDPNIVKPAIDRLKKEGVKKLLVNGDIGGHYGSLENSQAYTVAILNEIAESGLESYVQPGSHETLLAYGPIVEAYAEEYPHIINATKPENQKFEDKDHHLVFLPGSDFLCGGEYQIGSNEEIPTGLYIPQKDGLMPLESINQYIGLINEHQQRIPIMRYQNMHDLEKLIDKPEKTIVVCHVPRKFDNPEIGVDMAHFFEGRIYKRDNGEYDSFGVIPYVGFKEELAAKDNTPIFRLENQESMVDDIKTLMWTQGLDKIKVFVESNENRGNEDLSELYNKLGINKAVTGHFHESSHRAHDANCNPIAENTYVNELFWNSGHGDKGQFGVLTVNGEQVKYQNITL